MTRVCWVLAINLLAAGGETSPVFVYKNGESSSFMSCNSKIVVASMYHLSVQNGENIDSSLYVCHSYRPTQASKPP